MNPLDQAFLSRLAPYTVVLIGDEYCFRTDFGVDYAVALPPTFPPHNIRRDIERWPGGLFFKVAQIAQILIRRRIMAGGCGQELVINKEVEYKKIEAYVKH